MVWAISLAVCMRKISSGGLLLSHSNEHLCISHEVTSITYAFIPLEKLPREEHIKFDMIFPLLPALRSQTTLTSAGKITLYFLGSFKRERFHFRYNPGHLRKDLWLLFVRECFSFWLKLLLFFFIPVWFQHLFCPLLLVGYKGPQSIKKWYFYLHFPPP